MILKVGQKVRLINLACCGQDDPEIEPPLVPNEIGTIHRFILNADVDLGIREIDTSKGFHADPWFKEIGVPNDFTVQVRVANGMIAFCCPNCVRPV